jgi:hyperosmotically inducible periplasmic protein
LKSSISFRIAAAACLLLAAGCSRSSSDRGASGQDTVSDRGQGVSAPSPVDSTPNRSTPDAATRPPDDTGRNVRDRSDAALTPGVQSESKEDIDLVSRVRRAITKDDQLSTSGKNIKIIAAKGKVTLRGPVNSAAEKEQAAKTAQGVEGVTSVDDELEVKTNK